MEMTGTRNLPITQQQAWEALNDPEMLKACIPGCDNVTVTQENHMTIGMKLSIGPVSAKFSGKVALSDLNPPESYKLSFDGQGGAAGFGKGSADVKLTPNATGCELSYSAQAQVGGKIAQLGQRLIDGAAAKVADDFFKRFEEESAKRYGAVQSAAVTTPMAQSPVKGMNIPVWAWAGLALLFLAVGMYLVRG
jgi:uncharacterized protein